MNELKPVFLKPITYFNSNRKIPQVSPPTHNPACQKNTWLSLIGKSVLQWYLSLSDDYNVFLETI